MESTARLDTWRDETGAGHPGPMLPESAAGAVAVAAEPQARWTRVMVGVHDPHASVRMLEQAVELARDAGARLRIVHVVGGRSARLEARGLTPTMLEDVCRATGWAVLLEARDIARRLGVDAETILVRDDGQPVGRTLVAEARRWGADVIVLGTHADRGWRAVPRPLGTVATAVTRTAPVPVLLVPAGAAGPVKGAPEARHEAGPGGRAGARRRPPVRPVVRRSPRLRPVGPPPPR